MRFESIAQEDLLGCGIACVACALGISYKSAKKKFRDSSKAATKGYYCKELVDVLNNNKLRYEYHKFTLNSKDKLRVFGTIVFIERNVNYPEGHYLIRTKKGWMNPWINFPEIAPVKSGFQKKLPGKPQWVIHLK